MVRLIAIASLLTCTALAQNAWRFVPAKPQRVVSMQWRKVLNSPYNAALRGELANEFATVFRPINIIEGVERVLLASDQEETLIVLEGTFDPAALRDSAAQEGGVVQNYKGAEIIVAADGEAADAAFAIVGGCILLGYPDTLARAIDRSLTSKSHSRAAGFDLWIAAAEPSSQLEFSEVGWQIGSTLRVSGRLRLRHEIIGDLHLDGLTATGDGRSMKFATEFNSPAEYARYAGRIRAIVESAQPVAVPVVPGGKIRIYGLDEGVREVPLDKAKQ